MTEYDFDKIKRYFSSFGFIINYTVYNLSDNVGDSSPTTHDKNKTDKKNELNLYYFRLKTKTLQYQITFDYL